MNVLQVEVATYTRHATDSLGDFLFRTKLDPKKKAYSASTAIVVFVQRGCASDEIKAAHEEVLSKGARGLCYLVGRREGVDYEVVQVVPDLRGPQRVNLDDSFLSQQVPVAEVKRGMSAVTTVSDEPIPTANPFLSTELPSRTATVRAAERRCYWSLRGVELPLGFGDELADEGPDGLELRAADVPGVGPRACFRIEVGVEA